MGKLEPSLQPWALRETVVDPIAVTAGEFMRARRAGVPIAVSLDKAFRYYPRHVAARGPRVRMEAWPCS